MVENIDSEGPFVVKFTEQDIMRSCCAVPEGPEWRAIVDRIPLAVATRFAIDESTAGIHIL
jgi:hypothetical protein